jgi:hypothetical protein
MKKTLTKLMLICFFSSTAFAQDPAYTDNLIKRYESIRNPGTSFNKNTNGASRLCLTELLVEATKNWSKLTLKGQNMFKQLSSRPAYVSELTLPSQHFVFHYSKTDSNAVNLTDANTNGIPDYVERMAGIFEFVYSSDSLRGYTMPPPDGTLGGNSLYDVYIQKLGNRLYGSVAPETMINDNPNSKTVVEKTAYTSFMNMNNTYDWTKNSDTAMKVTASHEFFHAVQMGMTLADNQTNFVTEATAVWMEEELYPKFDDNLQYLSGIINSPDIALNINRNYDKLTYDDHWYAAWIYFKYLSERIAKDPVIIRSIFETLVDSSLNDIQGIDKVLKSYNSNFEASFIAFNLANLFLTKDVAYAPFYYDRGDVYASRFVNGMKHEGVIDYSNVDKVWDSKLNGNGRLQRISADYLKINSTGNFKVVFNSSGTPNTVIKALLIKRNLSKNTFQIVEPAVDVNNQTLNCTDAANWEQFTVMVTRYDKFVTDTLSMQYKLTVSQPLISNISSAEKSGLKIYPNPAVNNFSIDYPLTPNLELTVSDIVGKNILTINGDGFSNYSVSTANMENGLYFIELKSSGKTLDIRKILISK